MRRYGLIDKDFDAGKTEGKRSSRRQRMIWTDGITNTIYFVQALGDSEGQKPSVLQPMGSERQTETWQLNNNFNRISSTISHF